MSMKLLQTKHLGGTTFDLYFEVENVGENNHIEGQLFDIHGLAQLKFFICNTNTSEAEILFSVMKHELTMLVNVEITVIGENPQFSFTSALTEIWSKHYSLFELSYTKLLKFNMEVDIKVSSSNSVLDIMYIDEDFTDFQLSTSEGSVAVHRAILASHSDVFKRMLCGEWKETAAGCIEIEGVTLETLKNLKKYMYLGTLPEDGLCALLRIAAYYLIDGLKAECIIKLGHSVTSDNLYDLLEFSYANNVPELTFAILRAVRAQPREVIEFANEKIVKLVPKAKNENVGKKTLTVDEEPKSSE